MDHKELQEFVSGLQDADIRELTVESGETMIHFKKQSAATLLASTATPVAAPAPVKKELAQIKSPMVGTFYHSRPADRPPFVMVGNHVGTGQKVGVIEAMKVLKEVTAGVKGKIVEVLVETGRPVEYGQPLFLVDTEDTGA